ncbi:PQQ-binding-like beta-propeller repeat protein [Kitasatospora sp. NPDC006697]|uniref:outer membrane protein assembly factor BamB family protein n=1 Tax=Kitasatospora sp. NPDC006697 TaxID=3364020 RepID=UPI0036A8568F
MAGDQPDQKTQLDGASVPQPAQPPAGAADVSYQPTAPAFPAQPAQPAAAPGGAPMGPYDPQASAGYGYPQAGPAQSGYSAPGQPGPAQPYPTPQPGYQQPVPPQAGYQQPGAYPTPQPGYYQPNQTPPGKQRNPVMVFGAIAGSVLAIAIVIGLVVLFQPNHKPTSSAGTSGGPGPTSGPSGSAGSGTLAAAWTAPKPTDSSGDHRMIGVWTTDKYVVRGDAQALTAYNLSDGQVAWTLPAPSGTKAFCSMSKDTNKNNVGGVSFNLGDDDCAALGAVDATTGKLLFKLGSPLSNKSYDTQVTITDTTLVGASSALLAGYNLSDQKSAWSYTDRGKYCNENADASGGVVVVSDYCADSSPKQVMQVLDANTGKANSTITLNTENDRLSQIVSVKPLVVQVSSDGDNDYMVEIDGSGNPMAKVPLKVTGQDKLRLSAASAAEAKNLVIGNTLYVEVDQNSKTAIQAIDLSSGKTLWTSDGGAAQGLRLVDKPSATALPVIAIDGYDKGARLGTLSAGDGSFTPTASFNKKDLGFMAFQDSEVLAATDGSQVLDVQGLPIDSTAVLFKKK